LEGDLEAMKKDADAIREQRADLNRDKKRLQAQFDGMPKFDDAPADEINVMVLNDQLGEANAERMQIANERGEISRLEIQAIAEGDKANNALENAAKAEQALRTFDDDMAIQRNRILQEIEAAKAKLEEFDQKTPARRQDIVETQANAKEEAEQHKANQAKLEKEAEDRKAKIEDVIASQTSRIEDLQNQIKTANETNEKVRKNKARSGLFDEIRKLDADIARHTDSLTDIAAKRTALLQAAQLPLPELSITEDGELQYQGQKWDCMSGSERLKVATAICMKAKPNCGFVLIDGLEAMDAQTLDEFGKYLESQQMQGIGTIVGDTAATVIIEDGKVKDSEKGE